MADGNISHQLDKNTEVGIDVHGITTNGLEKEYDWSSKQSDFNVAAFITSNTEREKPISPQILEIHNYNYYGIYALKPAADIDLKQSYNELNQWVL